MFTYLVLCVHVICKWTDGHDSSAFLHLTNFSQLVTQFSLFSATVDFTQICCSHSLFCFLNLCIKIMYCVITAVFLCTLIRKQHFSTERSFSMKSVRQKERSMKKWVSAGSIEVNDRVHRPPLPYLQLATSDVMLVWRKGNINENCLGATVLCTIMMVHKDTSSSYRSADCIGLWSCLV